MNSDEQVNARFPGWDFGMYRWAVKNFIRCRYQIPRYISQEDFLQLVYYRYYYGINKRKSTKAEKVTYFKRIVINCIITESRKVKTLPVIEKEGFNLTQEQMIEDLITRRVGVEPPTTGIFDLLRNAPRELSQLLQLFFTDDGKKLLSDCSTRIKSNGDRETNNELLCRLIGADSEKVDLQKIAEDYLNGCG